MMSCKLLTEGEAKVLEYPNYCLLRCSELVYRRLSLCETVLMSTVSCWQMTYRESSSSVGREYFMGMKNSIFYITADSTAAV